MNQTSKKAKIVKSIKKETEFFLKALQVRQQKAIEPAHSQKAAFQKKSLMTD
jgi:hypothetical protein